MRNRPPTLIYSRADDPWQNLDHDYKSCGDGDWWWGLSWWVWSLAGSLHVWRLGGDGRSGTHSSQEDWFGSSPDDRAALFRDSTALPFPGRGLEKVA